MQGILVRQVGGPEVLHAGEVPFPDPGPGEAVVRLNAVGINYIDVYHRTGRYPVPLPFTPGQEAAGVVAALGRGVEGLRIGDRVAYANQLGSYAEFARVPAAKLVALPEHISDRDAAAVMLQGLTAHFLSHDTYPIQPGDTVLIHAGAGGVGLLLSQMAKARNARVITTVSTEAKAALSRAHGADEVILYTQVDFATEVRRLTEAAGVHVVYDSVGLTTFEKSLSCLRARGMLVLYGASSGPVPPFDPLLLMQKGSLYLTRPTLVNYIATRAELVRRSNEVLGWVAGGTLRVQVGGTYPLADAARAHRELEGRATTGKLLLLPS